jgi:hypothetical protein
VRPSTPTQTADTLTQIEQLAARLRLLEPTVRQRAGTTGRDGYPPMSGPDAGHGRGGDPVGNLVALRLDHPRGDILAAAHTDLLSKIHEARRLLEQAESAGRQALPPVTNLTDDGCVSCARIRRWSPIHRGRRCRWCGDWTASQGGGDPPIDILHAHHDGRRVTVRLVQTILRRRC